MALTVCSATVGCGDHQNEQELESKMNSTSEEDIEKEIEKIAESIEASESLQEAAVEETLPEIVYEPTDEILNADFSSGLVQIGNDVFRNGGYYTVNQFIAEFENRYDMSEINPNGLLKEKGTDSVKIVSKEDENLSLRVSYTNGSKEDKISVGEAVVLEIEASSNKEENCWYPKGIRCTAEGYDYDNIPTFLEENGFKLTEDLFNISTVTLAPSEGYGVYWEYSSSSLGTTIQAFKFNDVSSEKNLLGCYPLYVYGFFYRLEDAKAYNFDVHTYAEHVNDLNEYPRITE